MFFDYTMSEEKGKKRKRKRYHKKYDGNERERLNNWSVCYPYEFPFLSKLIKLRVFQQFRCSNVLISEPNNYGWCYRKQGIEKHQQHPRANRLRRKRVEPSVPELKEYQQKVLVHHVEDDATDSMKGPGSMDEEELGEESEFGDWEIGRTSCLASFEAIDTDTHISNLNHTDIIAPVTNGKGRLFHVNLDKGSYFWFLQGTKTITDNCTWL